MYNRIVLAITLGYLILATPVRAEETDGKGNFIFDKKTTYSICYKLNEWNFSLVENANIEQESSFAGKGILVFGNAKSFSTEDSKGFIVMDSVIAILPTDQAWKQRNTFCKATRIYHGKSEKKE